MHPVLQAHLDRQHPAGETLQRAFVYLMGSVVDQLASKELHEQRGLFALHGGSFHYALHLAHELGMDKDVAALTQSLGTYALTSRDYAGAEQLYKSFSDHHRQRKYHIGEANAFHHLGVIAQEQHNVTAAEKWFRKSLVISEKQGNIQGMAANYYHLGTIAQGQRNFTAAEKWFRRSLAVSEKQGNEHGAAIIFYHLGVIAQKQQNFATAEKWYKKSASFISGLTLVHKVIHNVATNCLVQLLWRQIISSQIEPRSPYVSPHTSSVRP